MFESIMDIGRYQLTKTNKSDLEQLLDDSAVDRIIVIDFILQENEVIYSGISLEGALKRSYYLYRRRSSNGANYSVTGAIGKTLEDTLKNRILSWFKLPKVKTDDYFQRIGATINQAETAIVQELNQLEIDTKNLKWLMTIRVNQQFIGEIPRFVESFFSQVEDDILAGAKEHQCCSVCGDFPVTVTGKLSVYKFYTTDKRGFITGGFHEEDAWRNFPVCLKCVRYVEEGRKQIEDKLRFNFYGLNYYIIPQFIHPPTLELQHEIMARLLTSKQNVTLDKTTGSRLTNDEEEIFDYLSNEGNSLTLHFVFLEKQNAAERILLHIQGVNPSKLKQIFISKKNVERKFFSNQKMSFNFSFLRTFFDKTNKSSSKADLNKYFLKIVENIFLGKEVDETFVMKFILIQVRQVFHEIATGQEISEFTKLMQRAVVLLEFLYDLQILRGEIVVSEHELKHVSKYYDKFTGIVHSPERKVIFLMGVLSGYLLDYQSSQRGGNPFYKQLRQLKMTKDHVIGLLAKITDKLHSYNLDNQPFIRSVLEELTLQWGQSNEDWKLTVDQINGVFAAGMYASRGIIIPYGTPMKEKETKEHD